MGAGSESRLPSHLRQPATYAKIELPRSCLSRASGHIKRGGPRMGDCIEVISPGAIQPVTVWEVIRCSCSASSDEPDLLEAPEPCLVLTD